MALESFEYDVVKQVAELLNTDEQRIQDFADSQNGLIEQLYNDDATLDESVEIVADLFEKHNQ
jgi:hypothetical protein